jgi:hypothetical protein
MRQVHDNQVHANQAHDNQVHDNQVHDNQVHDKLRPGLLTNASSPCATRAAAFAAKARPYGSEGIAAP